MTGKERKRVKKKGCLVLIGGREQRSGKMRILKRMVKVSEAKTISIFPSASRHPGGVRQDYEKAFRSLGIEQIHFLDIRHRDEADLEENLECVRESDLFFFTGGDQVRLVKILGKTRLMKEISRKHAEGATIGGTSAGAAAASDPMLFDGQDRGLDKGRVRHGPGFGLIEGVTVDTHFFARNRIPRLAQFLARGLSRHGIGLAENTAFIIHPDGTGEVAGAGPVAVLSRNGKLYSNYERTARDEPISVHGLKLGFLSAGIRFNVRRWAVVPG